MNNYGCAPSTWRTKSGDNLGGEAPRCFEVKWFLSSLLTSSSEVAVNVHTHIGH